MKTQIPCKVFIIRNNYFANLRRYHRDRDGGKAFEIAWCSGYSQFTDKFIVPWSTKLKLKELK